MINTITQTLLSAIKTRFLLNIVKISSQSLLSKTEKLILMFFLVFIFKTGNAQPVESGDWSSVRLYGHAFNINDFSDGDYDWIEDNFEYFTIEKRHARVVYGDVSSERASAATAATIIANNSKAKPLFYWNTGPVYSTIYETIQEALVDHPDWVGTDSNRWTFEDPEFRTWFVDVVKDMVNNEGHSGVFLDAVMTLQGHTSSEAASYCLEMMDEMPGTVIYNGFTPVPTRIHAGLDYLEHADGVFVEHFFRAHCDSQNEGEYMLDELLQVPSDKIIIANSQPEDTFWETTDHKFSLAAFLIIANENSYYHYFSTENYSSEYMTYWHSDFEEEIGEPLGSATKEGYVYTRTFENAFVTVDLENKTSSIEWGPTGTTTTVSDLNLALEGVARQSSTAYEASGEASKAIDGDTNGVYSGGSVTHTEVENNAYWQVTLDDTYSIGDINVYGRTDSCCVERLSNFTVLVYDVYSRNFTEVVREYPNPSVTVNAGGVSGNIIRIRSNTGEALSLAEVEVFEATSSAKDVALIKNKESELGLYPNPTKGSFQINSINIQSIEVYNLSGELVKSFDEVTDVYVIDGLVAGVYMVKTISNDGELHIEKLIKL